MFGHFAHFSPKKYSVQKKIISLFPVWILKYKLKNPEVKDQIKGFKVIYKSSR